MYRGPNSHRNLFLGSARPLVQYIVVVHENDSHKYYLLVNKLEITNITFLINLIIFFFHLLINTEKQNESYFLMTFAVRGIDK